LRPAQVGGDHDPRPRLPQLRQGGHRGADAAVVGDRRTVAGAVEARADQHGPPGHALGDQVVARLHSCEATSAVAATSAREQPRSLSYQPNTLTWLPMTLGSGAS